MARSFVYLVLAASVTSTLGEFVHLRGQPRQDGALAPEQSHESLQAVPSSSNGLIHFFKTHFSSHRSVKSADPHHFDIKEFFIMSGSEILVGLLLWLPIYFLLAAYYHNYVKNYAPPDATTAEKNARSNYQDFQAFKSGLFDCAEYPGICFWACCCPGIRWADTVSKLAIHRFWTAFSLMTAIYCIGFIPLCSMLCFFFAVCYMTYYRQEFRKKFDFEEQGGSTYAKDCLTYLCCMWCAVAQEARHTRDAEKADHPEIKPISQRVNH